MLGIRHTIECAWIIAMIIQSARVLPSGPEQADAAANVSRRNPTGAVVLDGMQPVS
jgi:hypothetical protein